MKKKIQTILAIIISILLTGLGVALFVHANLGSDTLTVFVDGLHRVLNCSYGAASRIYNLIVLVIALIVSRKNIGWATIVYALSVGFTMDYFEKLLQPLQIQNADMITRLICVCLGQICFGITYALLIKYRRGMNQIDAISYAIVDKTGISFKWVRTGMNVLLLTSGWLLGGVVGVGSIIAMTTTGVLVDFILNVMSYKEKNNEEFANGV